MNTFFILLKSLIIFLISIIIIPFFLTILNILKLESNKILIIIINAVLMFIIGLITGNKTNNKAYLKGLLLSTICILLLLLTSIIFNFNININSFIYYIILIISTTFGSMIGINKKIKK